MKKLIPVLILVLLFVSACHFPEETDLSQDPVVQTRVALLLTQGAPSVSTNEPPSQEETKEETTMPEDPAEETEEPVIETPVITDEPTTLPDQPTQEPPVPTEEVEIPTVETPAPTLETVEPTLTTPEPTIVTPEPTDSDPGDPWSGSPDLLEEFDSGTYWDFEGDHLLSKVSNGKLEFTSKGTPWWSSWYTTYPAYKNGYFETTFTMPNCAGSDRFGLVIRWGESNEFYYLGVTCDGSWGFSYYTKDNQTHDIVAYTKTTILNPASETNRIGILAKDNAFTFYINGESVGSANHDALKEAGSFGFLSMSTGTKDFKTLIDKLEYWTE